MDFSFVTEVIGDQVSEEQLNRSRHRYLWAASHCVGKDVLEVACGTGQGLSLLAKVAQSIEAGDVSPPILEIARSRNGSFVHVLEFSADDLPFEDSSKDVILLLEALYYLPDPDLFLTEAKRVLRSQGKVLIATANKDLFDFNPSPLSHEYMGVMELAAWLRCHGLAPQLFGYMPLSAVPWRQRMLRPVKKIAVRLGIVPKTMKGKKFLKRIVFGRLVRMPSDIEDPEFVYSPPEPIDPTVPDLKHKIIYCVATLNSSRPYTDRSQDGHS